MNGLIKFDASIRVTLEEKHRSIDRAHDSLWDSPERVPSFFLLLNPRKIDLAEFLQPRVAFRVETLQLLPRGRGDRRMRSTFGQAQTSVGLSNAREAALFRIEIEILLANVNREVQESLHVLEFFPRPTNEILAVDEVQLLARKVLEPGVEVHRVATDANRRPTRKIHVRNELIERRIGRMAIS